MNADPKTPIVDDNDIDGEEADLVASRVSLVLLYLAGSVWLGWLVADFFRREYGLEGLVPISAVILLAFAHQWEKVSDLWGKMRKYCRGGKKFGFPKYALAVAAPSTVGILIAMGAWQVIEAHGEPDGESENSPGKVLIQILGLDRDEPPLEPINYETIKEIVSSLRSEQTPERLLYVLDTEIEEASADLEGAVLPIPFRNASLKQSYVDGRTLTTQDFLDGAAGGVDLTTAQSRSVELLVNALSPCTRDIDHPVVIDVTGFASSLSFDDYSGQVSDRLNLQVANLRAENVTSSFCHAVDAASSAGLVDPQNIRVRFEPHPDPASMEDRRPFDDRPEGAGDGNPSESLNRAAFIRIASAGTCNRSEIQPDIELTAFSHCEIVGDDQTLVNAAR